jgi:hypothetical protein
MTRDYHDGSLPVNYGRASGWFDAFPKDPKVVESFLPNPIGVGHLPVSPNLDFVGEEMPNTQKPDWLAIEIGAAP